ncbi:MAG: HAD family hydrolase [Candidatus Liptonbacteria bacterium]|nr:HAD family hydrolase [Candidatus Liptonbacteria bacterium]
MKQKLVKFSKINLRGTKAILLDLDNTLYDYRACHEYAILACYKKFTKVEKLSFEDFLRFYERAKEKIKKRIPTQAASHSRLLYFQALLENYFGKTNVDLTLDLETLYWKSFFGKMKLAKGALGFLKECKENHIKICLVTDLTARIQFKKVKLLKIAKYIDFIVSSEEAGREKPAPHIFKLALQKVGFKRGDVMVLGDSYKRDMLGAKGPGLRAVLVKK